MCTSATSHSGNAAAKPRMKTRVQGLKATVSQRAQFAASHAPTACFHDSSSTSTCVSGRLSRYHVTNYMHVDRQCLAAARSDCLHHTRKQMNCKQCLKHGEHFCAAHAPCRYHALVALLRRSQPPPSYPSASRGSPHRYQQAIASRSPIDQLRAMLAKARCDFELNLHQRRGSG